MNEKMTSRANAATKRYLELRGFEILEEGWSHGTDTADFIAIDGETSWKGTSSRPAASRPAS